MWSSLLLTGAAARSVLSVCQPSNAHAVEAFISGLRAVNEYKKVRSRSSSTAL